MYAPNGIVPVIVGIDVLREVVLLQQFRVAGRERDSIAVVDRAARDRSRDRHQPRIVQIAPVPVGLQGQRAGARGRIGADDLHPRGLADHDEREHARAPGRGAERERGRVRCDRWPARFRESESRTPKMAKFAIIAVPP